MRKLKQGKDTINHSEKMALTWGIQPFVFIIHEFRIALGDCRFQADVSELGILSHKFGQSRTLTDLHIQLLTTQHRKNLKMQSSTQKKSKSRQRNIVYDKSKEPILCHLCQKADIGPLHPPFLSVGRTFRSWRKGDLQIPRLLSGNLR